MRPAEVVRRAADYLDRHDVDAALPTAELLLAHVLGTDRSGIYTRSEGLSAGEAKAFGRALCLRCTGHPVQHLTREQGFRRLALEVRPGVFVPRPETEVLVEVALGLIEDVPEPAVADVGTGCGAVALSVADERPDARVWATDLAPEAVALARENATRLGLAVEVLEGDLLSPLSDEMRGGLDLVVSNPPYVDAGEIANLPLDVLADPELALIGGIDLYGRLFAEAASWLRPGGAVAVEIGRAMGRAVGEAAAAAGFFDVDVRPDLVGRDRVVVARRP